MPKTKIIATLGPSSNSETVLRRMFASGADIVRLNFSHGTVPEHTRRVKIVRKLNKEMRRTVRLMQDLEGYRIRIGKLVRPLTLERNRVFYLTSRKVLGTAEEISFDYQGPLNRIKKGTPIYVDDGRIVLKVKESGKQRLKVRVVTPGILSDSKGVNIPDVNLEFSALTDKDKRDIRQTLEYRFDYIAQSFVRRARDLKLLKSIVKPRHPQCRIFAKIESREALKNLDRIIDESDGIIVARGDLGICVPIYKVPVIQKEIIKRCRLKDKPVVVATQMLESMIASSIPTRAEASDVANAILDGATHLLLSAETAVGRHPAKVIAMMDKIIVNTENYVQKLESILE